MNLKDKLSMMTAGLELLIVWKKKNKIHFIDLWWFWSRNKSMKLLFKEALEKSKKENIPPILINTWDRPFNKYFKYNIFSFSTTNWFYDKIIPDFIYDSWKEVKIPSYNQVVEEMVNAWKNKALIDKIWWIWNFNTSPSRLILADLGEKYPQYLDVKNSSQKGVKWMTMEDLVQTYWYLIDVEWAGYSWRLKLLFFSWRPIFVQERKWKDFALLMAEPNKHYIPVKNDFSDLIEKIIELKSNPQLSKEFWKNAKEFAENVLSREAAINYIKEITEKENKDKFNCIKIVVLVMIRFSQKVWNGIKLFLFNKVKKWKKTQK